MRSKNFNKVKKLGSALAIIGGLIMTTTASAKNSVVPSSNFADKSDRTNIPEAKDLSQGANNFYKSDKVDAQKVSFKTQYGLKVTGNFFTPKNLKKDSKSAAIIVGHPMGAVKEQSSNLYAQKLAEQGFVTLAIDLLFWGESEGSPRNAVQPDLYSESFSAAVDFLGTHKLVDRQRIGVLGICGSGSYSVSAAKIDPRMRAIATVSMYDMGEDTREGTSWGGRSLEERKKMLEEAAEQRYVEFQGGQTKWLNGLPLEVPDDAPRFFKEFRDFYRTKRAAYIHKGQTFEQTQNRALTQEVKLLNHYPFADIETISPRPLLFVAGDLAHSKVYSEKAFKLAAEPKELFIVKNATHVDLYDKTEVIPFDKLTSFFTKNLKEVAAKQTK